MAKAKTNQLRRVDIRGMNIGDNATAVEYEINGWTYRVNLTTTACNYGNLRYWFMCPRCYGRKATLYLSGNGWLACRKCYGLAYPVENKTRSDRAIDGAFKLNQRLGFDGGIDDFGEKPKGMHSKTFNRLIEKRDDYSAIFWGGIGSWMGRRGWIDL